MKINKVISVFLTACMLISNIPCVSFAAENVVEKYADIHDFDDSKAYQKQLGERAGMGHWYYKNKVGGKAADDSYMGVLAQQEQCRFTLLKEDETKILLSEITSPLVVSTDVYPNGKLGAIYFATSRNLTNTMKRKVLESDLNAGKWNNVLTVFVPIDEKIKTYTFINSEYKFESEMDKPADGEGEIRFVAEISNYSSGSQFFLDNIKAYTLSEFNNPEILNSPFLNDDGKLIGYYGVTAGELLDLIPFEDKMIVDQSETSVEPDRYLSAGMKLRLEFEIAGEGVLYREFEFDHVESDVDLAIDSLSMPNEVTESIDLPAEIKTSAMTGAVSVEWNSSNTKYLSNDGTVVRPPAKDVLIYLTASFSNKVEKKEIIYEVTVKSEGKPTNIDFIYASLSSKSVNVGDIVTYDMKQYDDYGAYDMSYTVSCDNAALVIDPANKTLTSDVAGVYNVKFKDASSDFEEELLLAFNDPDDYHIISYDEVYSEDFEGECDNNIMVTGAAVEDFEGSKAMHIPGSGAKKSAVFGATDSNGNMIALDDYVVDADVYVVTCVGASQANFSIRMRDNKSAGYQFAYHEVAFTSESEPTKIATSATGDFTQKRSLFSTSRGGDTFADKWYYGNMEVFSDIYNSRKKGFDKTYHIQTMIVDGKFVGKVMDGARILYTQTTDLKDMDNGTSSIKEGYTSFISHSTEAYVDNVVISKPRWISDIKVETEKSIMAADDAQTAFSVYGKSVNGEWIELNEGEYSIQCTNPGAVFSNGVLTLDGTVGKYCIEVSAGNHCSVKDIEVNNNPDELQRIYDELQIENADNIKDDFRLPTISGCSIIWTSTNEQAAQIDGNVVRITRPTELEKDNDVNIKASIYGNGFIIDKEFRIVIKANISDEAAVNAAISNTSVPGVVTADISLAQSGDEGVAILWESNNPSVISASGVVKRASENTTVRLTATFSRGTVSKKMIYMVSVSGTNPSSGGNGSTGGNKGGGGSGFTIPKSDVVSGGAETDGNGGKMSFDDVTENSWFYDAVKTLYEKGIVGGVSSNEYQPQRQITREEFLKLICNALGISPDGSAVSKYTDVFADSWFAPYVNAATACGIVQGVSDTEFGAGEPITRQDMCVMLVRALEYTNKNMQYTTAENFFDDADLADYASDSVYKLKSVGIVSGSDGGRFLPNDFATRAEIAVMIANMLKLFYIYK